MILELYESRIYIYRSNSKSKYYFIITQLLNIIYIILL